MVGQLNQYTINTLSQKLKLSKYIIFIHLTNQSVRKNYTVDG